MTSKTIIIGLVAVAFVAGSIMTGTMAYAAPNGQPFQALWDAIENIELIEGPQGETGATGETGADGVGFTYIDSTFTCASVGPISLCTNTCSSGDKAIVATSNAGNTAVMNAAGTGFLDFVSNPDTLVFDVLCADFTP